MANPNIKFNRKKTEPGLKDLLDLLKKDIMLSLNCHAIAKVQSFDPDKQTISAVVSYKKSFFEKAEDGTYKTVLKDYPILLDVPVIVLGGGNWKLTFPIQEGDECLILFNDRDIDNWFQSGQVGPVASPRLHSFSDGIALVGLHSLANSIESYDTTRAVLGNGNAMVGVGETLIKIANENYTLNGLLQNLLTELQNLTTSLAALTVTGVTPGPGVSAVPSNATAITTIGTNINSIASQIAGLLE